MSVNKVILIGNVGKDPEVRRMQSGDAVVSFSLATSEHWRDKQTGERKEKVEWHTIVIFNEGLAKVAEQYVRKGSKLYVEGQLQTRKWTDKDGRDRFSTEIVLQKYRGELTLLDSPRDRGDDRREQRRDDPPPRDSGLGAKGGQGRSAPLDDEVPFNPELR